MSLSEENVIKNVLLERAKLLYDLQTDSVFQGFRPLASTSNLCLSWEQYRYYVNGPVGPIGTLGPAPCAGGHNNSFLRARVEWKSDDSDDESPGRILFYLDGIGSNFRVLTDNLSYFMCLKKQALKEHPLPNLLKLCKALASLQKYWEALEIINLSLKFAANLTVDKKKELRSLKARTALINLAGGLRLQNRHQTIAQGLGIPLQLLGALWKHFSAVFV
ncbi:hypothetical protein LguiB_022683 [Lonicera macranthoides]